MSPKKTSRQHDSWGIRRDAVVPVEENAIAHEEQKVQRTNILPNEVLVFGKYWKLLKLTIFAIIPALIVICQNIYNLVDDIQMLNANTILKENIKFSVKLGKVLHQIQIERGTTALFVSSGRNANVGERLDTLYRLTDGSVVSLEHWKTYSDLMYFQSKNQLCEYLWTFRDSLVEENKSVHDILAFYTDINTVLNHIIGESINIDIPFNFWTDLSGFELLLYGKEQAGIERALGSTYYAMGQLSVKGSLLYHEKYVLGTHFLNQAMAYSKYVKSLFDNLFRGTQLATDIDKMRTAISSNVLINASTRAGTVWFDNMTDYINILETIQNDVAYTIVQHTMDDSTHLENTLTACVIQLAIALIMVPIIIILVRNIVNISSKLSSRTGALEEEKRQTETLITKLEDERKRTEELLYQLLPKSVAMTIMENGTAVPESYTAATIMFSDVVGFTRISSHITPMEVVAMLNGLYMTIDGRLENYDVYKVETIGDGYMVASGLPKRNGEKHVEEIAKLSLDLLKTLKEQHIPYLNNTHIQLRIGFHTGPCVAGVVGIKMPRYCIFGDTVNTASRMESTGLPMRIQMTKSSAGFLNIRDEFQISKRGQIEVKGKGLMITYWLDGYQLTTLQMLDEDILPPHTCTTDIRQMHTDTASVDTVQLETCNRSTVKECVPDRVSSVTSVPEHAIDHFRQEISSSSSHASTEQGQLLRSYAW